ncbi:hypothetical protein [Micromonospora orduensis]|uniref:hypothetical protein n=1 Tax=Micromonospora orduensis TaxID=1420891 RepID=UPI0036366523
MIQLWFVIAALDAVAARCLPARALRARGKHERSELGDLWFPDPGGRRLAASGIKIAAALRERRVRPHVRGAASDALEDIERFVHPQRARWRGRLWRLARPWTWF